MKNITFCAEEHLIESARARARSEHTSLNGAFRQWLLEYTQHEEQMRRYDDTVAALQGQMSVGRKLTREEMNERKGLCPGQDRA